LLLQKVLFTNFSIIKISIRQNKLKKALKYLEKGREACLQYNEVENLAITHLNICAIQSQLGQYALKIILS